MKRNLNHIGTALFVFIVLTSVFLWLTGSVHFGSFCGVRPDSAACEADDDEHGEEHEDDHGPTALDELETAMCEHNVRTIDCNNCRYEVGVVKVEPSVAESLIKTGVVEKRVPERILRLTGEVQYDRTRVVDVPPPASGRVIKVNGLLGRKVERGEALAVIHSGDFGEAKAAFLQAYTRFEIACEERERQAAVGGALEKFLKSLPAGRGPQNNIGLTEETANGAHGLLGQWKSKLVGAVARLRLAQTMHAREKALWEKKVSSKADYDQAEQELQSARGDYDALVEELHLNLDLDRLRAGNAVKSARAGLNAAEQRLYILGLDQAAVTALPHQKKNGDFALFEVKAPRAGIIIAQNVSEGKYVETTQSLYTIADLSSLWVWCDVYERDLATLHEAFARQQALRADVRVAAFPNTVFAGTVDLVGSSMDEHTRTVKARVQVKNDDGKLKPGMFAKVEIPIPGGELVLLVPRGAVLSDEGTAFVFQQWKDNLWLRRDVTVGTEHGRYVEILDGLTPGATVVTSGAFMLKSDVLREKMGAGCAD